MPKQPTFRATMYGCDGDKILIWGPRALMKVPKKDALTLIRVCLAQQTKYTIVNVKLHSKYMRELAQLRKFTDPRRR